MNPLKLKPALSQFEEYKDKVTYFYDEFKIKDDNDKFPWEKHFEKINCEGINVNVGHDFDNKDLQTVIGLTIMTGNYALIQGNFPREYYIVFKGTPLNKMDDFDQHIVLGNLNLVLVYAEAHANEEMALLEKSIQNEIDDWNNHSYILQETLYNQLINVIAKKVDLPPYYVVKNISDFHLRLNEKMIFNYRKSQFIAEEIFDNNPGLKEKANFYNFIIDQTNNGGQNYKSATDLMPQFFNVNSN